MPPLDFPSSPTNGQEYQGYVYSTSVGAWQAKPAAQSPFYTSDTPPANPTKGDSWFNTNDGTMYVYVYDGNTYQWVEHRSQIARSQVGLVPITPTSIAVGSGTATTGLLGKVTFTGASSVSLNGIFNGTYNAYRIILQGSLATGAQTIKYRFRRLNVDDSTAASYLAGWYGIRLNGTSPNNYEITNSGFITAFNAAATGPQMFFMDIINPFATTPTTHSVQSYGGDSVTAIALSASGLHAVSTSYDGITIYPTGSNITGTVQVFGYNE